MNMNRYVHLVVLLLLLSGCTSRLTNAHDIIQVTVVNAVDTQVIRGVEVVIITKAGESISVGQTDELGEIALPKNVIADRARAVLFCQDLFFCGAIDIQRDKLEQYDDYFFAITPMIVR